MVSLLGIEPSTYSNIANCKTVLTINRIEQITDALEVPALRFITYNTQQFFDIHHNETGNGVAHYHYHVENGDGNERDKKIALQNEKILELQKRIMQNK
jgi:transcriptional regulator with XRE-family HTH domain